MSNEERDAEFLAAIREYVEGLKEEGYTETAAIERCKYEIAKGFQSVKEAVEERRQKFKVVK